MYKVLVVEDEELIRRGLVYTTDWLKMNCIIAGEAADGEEGLQKILEEQPDIVITDIRMPGMSGLEMIEKAKDEGRQFCSVILSSYSEFEYARTSIRLGVFEYLLKPVEDDELSAVIERAVKHIAAEKEKVQYQAPDALRMPVFPESSDNFYVAQTIHYIQTEYKTKLTVEAVAASLNVSVSYLSRKIKQVTDMTFLDLLNSYRIIRAAELLRTGRYRIYEVSDMTGFTDYKYFCTVFKRYTGYSPSALVHF